MSDAKPTLSDRYRALDKTYGAGVVSRGLAYLRDLPNDDRLLPERRYELVAAFCAAYEREKQSERLGTMAVTDGDTQ